MPVRRLTVLATVVAVAALPAAASAAVTAPALTGGICPEQTFARPFAAFADPADYTLTPGGDFEGTLDGWTVDGTADIVTDRVDNVGRGGDTRALRISAGTQVTSPPVCVTTDYRSLRFFARSVKPAKGILAVDVLYPQGDGVLSRVRVGLLVSAGTWAPTPVMTSAAVLTGVVNALAAARSSTSATTLRVRLTAIAGGDWEVDDLFVDPRLR